jgi:group II intron reverse transcriptase/maturase
MRAETTSKRVDEIAEASRSGKPINGLFRLLGNPEVLWKQAYANLYSNKGAITKGVNNNTLDGFSEERVNHLIRMLYAKRYRFSPARRTYIPKKNGKMRPLGIPTGDDKLVQEVVRILLELIYEPVFSQNSHGFRPSRSCLTGLEQVKRQWTGVKWIIEFDIKGFFDNIDHIKMIEILERKICDKRIVTLVKLMLKAGYMEEWKYHKTYSGTPQGGVISPILANIYLHELDVFMEELIESFHKGNMRKVNTEYDEMTNRLENIRTKIKRQKKKSPRNEERLQELYHEENMMAAKIRKIPSKDPRDAEYRRLRYVRYADDFIVGVIGSKQDAIKITEMVKEFVQVELKLELSEEKTCIKHAEAGVDFLGYEVRSYSSKEYVARVKINGIKRLKRTVMGRMQLHVPREKKIRFCAKHGYGTYEDNTVKAQARPELLNRSDVEIILTYNAEMRGITNYYAIATGYKQHLGMLIAKAQYSFFATLANKHKVNTPKIMQRLKLPNNQGYGVTVEVKGKAKIYNLFRLADHKKPTLTDANVDRNAKTAWYTLSTTELVQRLNANKCEYCGKEGGYMEVHHVRALKDVDKSDSCWKKTMSRMRRKTLVLCFRCHHELHGSGLPSWRKLAIVK